MEVEAPPELDVLIAACKPHATCEMDGFSDRESLYYPPNLPLTTTIELANHPILDAVRTSLFPRLATGQHLIAIKDKMELIPTGGHMCPQRLIPRRFSYCESPGIIWTESSCRHQGKGRLRLLL